MKSSKAPSSKDKEIAAKRLSIAHLQHPSLTSIHQIHPHQHMMAAHQHHQQLMWHARSYESGIGIYGQLNYMYHKKPYQNSNTKQNLQDKYDYSMEDSMLHNNNNINNNNRKLSSTVNSATTTTTTPTSNTTTTKSPSTSNLNNINYFNSNNNNKSSPPNTNIGSSKWHSDNNLNSFITNYNHSKINTAISDNNLKTRRLSIDHQKSKTKMYPIERSDNATLNRKLSKIHTPTNTTTSGESIYQSPIDYQSDSGNYSYYDGRNRRPSMYPRRQSTTLALMKGNSHHYHHYHPQPQMPPPPPPKTYEEIPIDYGLRRKSISSESFFLDYPTPTDEDNAPPEGRSNNDKMKIDQIYRNQIYHNENHPLTIPNNNDEYDYGRIRRASVMNHHQPSRNVENVFQTLSIIPKIKTNSLQRHHHHHHNHHHNKSSTMTRTRKTSSPEVPGDIHLV